MGNRKLLNHSIHHYLQPLSLLAQRNLSREEDQNDGHQSAAKRIGSPPSAEQHGLTLDTFCVLPPNLLFIIFK
jgi:hypothetical protein